MKLKPMSRRNFIRIGSMTMTIPFLESLPQIAEAATASGSLKRVIFYTFHNAWYENIVFPTSKNYLVGPEGVRYIPLNQITGDISQIFTAAKYGNIKSKMNLMRGFDLTSQAQGGGGHRSRYALCASDERSSSRIRDSIDTVISNAAGFYPTVPFRKSLNVLPVKNGRNSYNFSFQNDVERAMIGGPTSLFTEYFSGTLPNVGTGTTPQAPEDIFLSRRIAMNSVMNKFLSLSKNSRLPASDQQKLSQHADLINRIMPSLAAPTSTSPTVVVGPGCSKPATPPVIDESVSATSGVTRRIRLMMDQIYMIMNCQLTNVITMQPYHADDVGEYETDGGANETYHQMAGHHYDPPKYIPAKGWIFDQLLYLLNMMDATVESNGLTMLDNSLVVVLSNDGCSEHSSWDLPVITFGSLGGTIKTGNYINYQRTDAPQFTGALSLPNAPDAQGNYSYKYNFNLGRPLGTLYNTILNALKIPHSGFGEYVNVDNNYTAFQSAAAKQASLPILS